MRRWQPASRTVWALLLALSTAALAGKALAFDGAFRPQPGAPWNVDDGPVEYVLEPNGSADVDGPADLDAVRAAFRAWECVPGTKLRFLEGSLAGPARFDLTDGLNSVFWDESNELGLGPGTLGVTVSDNDPGTPRAAADIAFNGVDHRWSVDDVPSAVDVGSIAIHEIGHLLGLDHPCDKDESGAEFNCNGPERSIMTPVWDNTVRRNPLPDDEDGVRALYPSGSDDSTCDGPFRKGEPCACDGECVEGLVCVKVPGTDRRTCGETCASDNSDCGEGFTCVLGLPEGDGAAPGVCVKHAGGEKPAGAVCVNGNECADDRACSLLGDLSRSVCQEPCDLDSDCGELGRCFKGFCLGGATNEECEEPPSPAGCGCSSTTDAALAAAFTAVLLVLHKRPCAGRRP